VEYIVKQKQTFVLEYNIACCHTEPVKLLLSV